MTQVMTQSLNIEQPLPPKTAPIRALIVEPNPLWSDAHASILRDHDCVVTSVDNIEEASRFIHACYYHIVILEDQNSLLLQAINDNKWFEYMVVCVCSDKVVGMGEQFFWGSDLGATGILLDDVVYFSKRDYYPSQFWSRIEDQLQRKKLTGHLTIENPEHIETLSYRMTNNLIDHMESENPDNQLSEDDDWARIFYLTYGYDQFRVRVEYEIYDLLRRCIADISIIDTIQLATIDGGLSKAAVISVIPKIDGKWSHDNILKLGYHNEIRHEFDAYNKHVKFLLKRGPRADKGPITPLLSSVMYDFVENGRSFGDVYRDKLISIDEIESLLDDLFGSVYSKWFRSPDDGSVLARDYMDYLNCHIHRLEEPITHIESDPELSGYKFWGVDRLHFPQIPDFLPNPINYLVDEGFLNSLHFPALTAVTHGDLNANNILIRNNTEAWLIDFGRTANFHALRDFIQLETVVRFALMDGVSLRERYDMEKVLTQQRTFGQVARLRQAYTPTGANADILERAFRVTCKIRDLAWKTILSQQDESHPIARFRQYQMGLFFMSLTTVRFVKHKRSPSGLTTTQALHALMSAGLLVKPLQARR